MDSPDEDEMYELDSLVRQMIEEDFDHMALAKTLAVVDQYLLPVEPMTSERIEAMLEKLYWYWIEIDDLRPRIEELEALRTMTPAELKALRWFDECFDCGRRAWFQGEDFYVSNKLWHQACVAEPVMKDDEGMLCVGCFERRIGRQLCRDDFGIGMLDNPALDDRAMSAHRARRRRQSGLQTGIRRLRCWVCQGHRANSDMFVPPGTQTTRTAESAAGRGRR